MSPRIAVVGATGVVGETLLRLLEQRKFPCSELLALASARSAGSKVRFRGEDVVVAEATPEAFESVDLVFFAATGALSKTLAPEAVKRGATVIDKSSTWRMDPAVPLIVPEINADAIPDLPAILACPNCSTIGVVQALWPVHQLAGLKSMVVTTMQAASGSGAPGLAELRAQVIADAEALSFAGGHPTTANATHVFPRKLHNNVIPQCGVFVGGGSTDEELKLVNETQKIMSLPDLKVAATCVRVPVEVGHSASLYLQTERPVSVAQIHAAIDAHPGTVVMDDPSTDLYPISDDAADNDNIFVGRVRIDVNDPHQIWLWQVGDNLRKGAATNAIQIAEAWLQHRA
ncbi:MAG: aspartate-semialdehyde dehydrogenase [Planctomycetes bacterium]|nr:aspartate-semialdehyde dehydrogenase [Planctomycetota bacterium]